MIDMHYDILSILYSSYIRGDFSYLESFIKNYNDLNVTGVVANLYFMSEDEMKEELGDYFNKNISVLKMFKVVVSLFKKYLPNTKFIYSIEGCDYIKDCVELEELYKLGLRNILLVWNNKNKYGSGNRSNDGLTELGKEFLIKAIDLGISIDLSHMNKNTFWDTISLLQEQKKLGKELKVIVSHSNCFSLCNNPRNLDDEQILALSEFDVVMGIVSYGPFVSTDLNISDDLLKDKYLEHIEHATSLLGIDHVGVATDDMTFATSIFGVDEGKQIFSYNNVKSDLTKLLSRVYNKEEIEKILYKNIYNKLF